MVEPTGRYSVAFPKQWWYPACRSAELGRRPLAITLMETPLVLFRNGDGRGRPHALLDRCPHRNAPLSLGRVHPGGSIECGYHGWRFDGCGQCTGVPGLVDGAAAAAPARAVTAYDTVERDGFVWVWGAPSNAGTPPTREPFALPEFEGQGTGEAVFACDLDCTLHAALENSLDVPHTAFLHRGIFRGGSTPVDITAIRRELPDGLEVQFMGEPVGFGPIRRRNGSGGGPMFDHWDRFFLPGIAQIEYRIDGWLRIVNTILHLPMAPFRTRAWFVVRYWTRAPGLLVKPIVLARGRGILKQDAAMLAEQAAAVQRFGGERYTSSELDLMGNGIWRLLRRAEHGADAGNRAEAGEAADGLSERTVTFQI